MGDGVTAAHAISAQGRLLLAVMLRDVKTRFGGSEWGFLLAIAWPLIHVLVLLLVATAMGRTAPYGDSVALWYATGVVPFMAFSYMSRFLSLGVVLNKPLLSFPIVKVTDLLFARAIVEVLSAGVVILILFAIFFAYGIEFLPRNIVQASLALMSMILLGLGFGVLSAIISAANPFFVTGYAILLVIFYMSSGIMFVPDVLPEAIRTPLSYLPWVQGVEWMRSAYYDNFGTAVLDREYLVSWGVVSLVLGLGLERAMRGKLLSG
jgi:capsular polysaccharide transport system permease protein